MNATYLRAERRSLAVFLFITMLLRKREAPPFLRVSGLHGRKGIPATGSA